ncbi:MAG: hypothetical protein Q8M29_14765 [Bacteroidota bacterium]|nr:hypothetical protein [Bacteroidota bacterium]
MKTIQLNTKFRKVLARLLSLSMILVFILLSVVVKPSSDSKPSEIKSYDKAKNDYSENDFLLFEEDDELSDTNKNEQEWLKNFSFDVHNRSLHISFTSFSRSKDVSSLRHPPTTTNSLPLFISICSLKI